MFNHIKSLLWLLLSVSFCLAAVIHTVMFAGQQDAAFDDLAAGGHVQDRNVFTRQGNDRAGVLEEHYRDDASSATNDETYTGLEILHSLPEWSVQSEAVEVDGVMLLSASANPLPDELDTSRELATAVLDLQAEYDVRRVYNSAGKIQDVFFYRR